jgi:hypothetical protein
MHAMAARVHVSQSQGIWVMSTSLRYHKERSAKLTAENRALRSEAKAAHRTGFEEGCRSTTLLSYLAVQDYGLDGIQWLSDRISAAAGKKDLPLSSYEVDKAVTRSVIESMKRYSPTRAAEVEASFATFLSGDSSK